MAQNGSWVEMRLARMVQSDESDRQFIFLAELQGSRGFPIVIGDWEANEMERVVNGVESKRPLTHQLLHATIRALGASLKRVDIVDLRDNTFYAQLVLENKAGEVCAVVDARPSDAIALSLRARCPIRVAEHVLAGALTDAPGAAPLPEPPPKAADEDAESEEG